MLSETEKILSGPVIMEKARALYEAIKPQVETPQTIGQFIIFDVVSGDYEINRDRVTAVLAVRVRHQNAQTGTLRVGYKTTYFHGRRPQRTEARMKGFDADFLMRAADEDSFELAL